MANPPQGPKDATPITRAHNRAVLDALPFGDTRDFEDARRGFLGSLPEVEIKNDQGRVVWSLGAYAFLGDEAAPPTVNPSLWRQARLNLNHGLFQVTDRVYQIRGFDISNMTLSTISGCGSTATRPKVGASPSTGCSRTSAGDTC
jgi:linear primary-alkylsulfatase